MQKYFRRSDFFLLSLLFCCCFIETSCSQILLSKKVKHNLIPDSAISEQSSTENPSGKAIDLSGQWTIGYRWRGAATTGTMWLKQNGQNFSGDGKDNENGPAFKIERGTLRGNEVIFLKRYENDSAAPVQYHGQFSFLTGESGAVPYMGGDFSRESGGNMLAGDWEAMQKPPENTATVKEQVQPVEAPVSEPSPPAVALSKSPDLSGKWELAFEYNFKIIHSTMFLEQEGNKLTGHGVDKETGAKFTITKGWYNFPHIGFTRLYAPTKKGNHASPAHETTFKADITMVNDNDYSGPYLSGKTQGGGSWEGQRQN